VAWEIDRINFESAIGQGSREQMHKIFAGR